MTDKSTQSIDDMTVGEFQFRRDLALAFAYLETKPMQDPERLWATEQILKAARLYAQVHSSPQTAICGKE